MRTVRSEDVEVGKEYFKIRYDGYIDKIGITDIYKSNSGYVFKYVKTTGQHSYGCNVNNDGDTGLFDLFDADNQKLLSMSIIHRKTLFVYNLREFLF